MKIPQNTDSADNNVENNQPSKEEHSYFINNDNFEKLKHLQQELYQALDISIKIRKIANLLITEENIQKLKQQLLEQYKL